MYRLFLHWWLWFSWFIALHPPLSLFNLFLHSLPPSLLSPISFPSLLPPTHLNVGQERYHSITQHFYINTHAVLVCYDTTDQESFQEATQCWYQEAVKYMEQIGLEDVVVLFVGTKSDRIEDRKVELRYAKDFCKKQCLLPPVECSSKSGKNVDKVFQVVITEMVKKGIMPRESKTKISAVSQKGSCCS